MWFSGEDAMNLIRTSDAPFFCILVDVHPQAFWGNSAFANDWQWVIGNPLSTLLGAVFAALTGAAVFTTGTGYGIVDSFLVALTAFFLTWLAIFPIRFISLPAEYYFKEKARADRLENVDGRQQAKTKLWELRAEGVGLRNKGRKLQQEADVVSWTKRYEAWHELVLKNASIYSPELRHALETFR
jgi:hypothetical protein